MSRNEKETPKENLFFVSLRYQEEKNEILAVVFSFLLVLYITND